MAWSRPRRRTLLALAAVVASCGGDEADDRRSRTEQPGSRLPAELIGTWASTGRGDAELVYVFLPDGTYKHAGVLLQQREAGLFKMQVAARGAASTRGRTLTLRPRKATLQISDPDDRTAKRERRLPNAARTYRWSVEGSGRRARLSLTDRRGATIAFAAQ